MDIDKLNTRLNIIDDVLTEIYANVTDSKKLNREWLSSQIVNLRDYRNQEIMGGRTKKETKI